MRYLRFFSTFLTLAALSGLIACSTSSKQSCNTVDWFEIGRQDGVLGKKTSSLQSYLKSCEGQTAQEVHAQYQSGRDSGLVDYCSRSNAWELGRTGQDYNEVCPDSLRKSFIRFYQRGRKLYEMERQNSKLSEEINDISSRLRDGKMKYVEKLLLMTELDKLKNRRENLQRQIGQSQISTIQ